MDLRDVISEEMQRGRGKAGVNGGRMQDVIGDVEVGEEEKTDYQWSSQGDMSVYDWGCGCDGM